MVTHSHPPPKTHTNTSSNIHLQTHISKQDEVKHSTGSIAGLLSKLIAASKKPPPPPQASSQQGQQQCEGQQQQSSLRISPLPEPLASAAAAATGEGGEEASESCGMSAADLELYPGQCQRRLYLQVCIYLYMYMYMYVYLRQGRVESRLYR